MSTLSTRSVNLFNFNMCVLTLADYMHVCEWYGWYYSRASEQRTLWERAFCLLFGGCPYLGGLPLFDINT